MNFRVLANGRPRDVRHTPGDCDRPKLAQALHNEGDHIVSTTRRLLEEMRTSRRAVFTGLEGMQEARLTQPALWGGREMDARFILLRYADHEEEHALQVRKTLEGFGWRQTEAQQILGAAEMTRGHLYSALVGLTDADMDLAPEGEWPLRLTLWHIVQTEINYTAAITWAADLFRQGREWEPHVRPEWIAEEGDFGAFVAHLDRERENLLTALTGLEDGVMIAPTRWSEIRVDNRFRLMRIAHHEREHTAHILKWRQQVGRELTDAQRLLGNAWSARGVLEAHLVGLPDDLLDREPANGDGTIRSILEHLQKTDELLKGWVLGRDV
jgi:hypothetical protein